MTQPKSKHNFCQPGRIKEEKFNNYENTHGISFISSFYFGQEKNIYVY